MIIVWVFVVPQGSSISADWLGAFLVPARLSPVAFRNTSLVAGVKEKVLVTVSYFTFPSSMGLYTFVVLSWVLVRPQSVTFRATPTSWGLATVGSEI